MIGPIETKLALPALVVASTEVLGGALYAVVLEFGWLDPTPEQNTALVGVGGAIGFVLWLVVGYLAPHTSRPDLEA